LVAAALLGYAGAGWWNHAATWVTTDNAYVAAHIHQVSSRVTGTVEEVLVDENQVVQANTLLARLDRRDFEVKRSQAEAQLARSQAATREAEAQLTQAEAKVAQQQALGRKAGQDFDRAKALFEGGVGAISKQEFEAAQTALDSALAGLRAAEAAVASARAQVAAAQAGEKVARANLQDAELQLSYTEITAPAAGRIGRKNLESGNRAQPGQALLALVEPEVWVVANLKETQLKNLRPGQPVRLRVDAFPGRVFTGRVDSLAPASGAQFALLPPDNATGNFTKIVQRVPVKIVLDRESLGEWADRIVPGLSTTVEIQVRS
jgi:membrane fusion protein (multidrug efflux system)